MTITAREKLTAICALHFAEYIESDYDDEDGRNQCADDGELWPCATHLIIHPECDSGCHHVGVR